MVEIQATYEGNLRCKAIHAPSNTSLLTDAPKDNMGKGEAFSPTDLVATALGTCMLTTMAIVAQRIEVDLTQATVRVLKDMVAAPQRRIGSLTVEIAIPFEVDADQKQRLENAALSCPVHKSLHPDVKIPVSFKWG